MIAHKTKVTLGGLNHVREKKVKTGQMLKKKSLLLPFIYSILNNV